MKARASALLLACIGLGLALGTLARSGSALSFAAAQGHARLLGTATPVTTLAADGPIAAVSTDCGKRFLEEVAWNPLRRSVVSMGPPSARGCGASSTGEGIWEQGMAGQRLAWVPYAGGNYRETYLFTATVGRPRSMTTLVRQTIHNTDDGTGDWVGNVHGDGSLLVFNTWSLCFMEPEIPGSCPAGVPPHTYHISNEKLWRVVGAHKRLLVTSKDELTVLSVAAGASSCSEPTALSSSAAPTERSPAGSPSSQGRCWGRSSMPPSSSSSSVRRVFAGSSTTRSPVS
jgi:hypothetical protein